MQAILIFAFQLSPVQTFVANRVTKSLVGKIDGKVEIGRVYYLLFRKLIVTDVSLTPKEGDSVLAAKKLSLRFHPRALLSGKLQIDRLTLDRGEFNLVQLTDSTTNLDLLFIANSNKKSDKESSFSIDASKISIREFTFTLKDTFPQYDPQPEGVIDFQDLHISSINLDIEHFQLIGDSISAKGFNLNFKERSGYRVERLQADVTVAPGAIRMERFHLKDQFSNLNATNFNLLWEGEGAFKHFLQRVSFETQFTSSQLDFNSLAYFASDLEDNKLYINFEGEIKGPISNLTAQNIVASSKSGATTLELNSNISGLPNSQETMLFVDIKKSRTTAADIAAIVASLDNSYPDNTIRSITPLTRYSFNGRLAGLFTDFVVNGTLSSNVGTIITDALFKSHSEKGFEISGLINTKELDLGRLLDNKLFGKLSLSTKLSALFREKRVGGDLISIDTLHIANLDLNNYSYKNIFAAGKYENQSFDGKLICRDPNLNLLFQGIVDLTIPQKGKSTHYDFFADLIFADLVALNLDKRDLHSTVSLTTAANFVGQERGDITGTIDIYDFQYNNSAGSHSIGDISILSSSQKENYSVDLNSQFAKATYRGALPIPSFATSFIDIASHSLNALIAPSTQQKERCDGECSLNIEFNETASILQFLLPGLKIAKGTEVRGEINRCDSLSILVKSDEVAYKNSKALKLTSKTIGTHKGIGTSIISSLIDAAGVTMESTDIKVMAINNDITIKAKYLNQDQVGVANMLNFHSLLSFTRSVEDSLLNSRATIFPSEINFNGTNWAISQSTIENFKERTQIKDFRLQSEDQLLSLSGAFSNSPEDTLSILLKNLDITPISDLLNAEELTFRGNMSGTTQVINLLKSPVIDANLIVEDIELNSHPFGTLNLKSEWNDTTSCVKIEAENSWRGATPLLAEGFYKPKEKELDLQFKVKGISSAYLEPLFVDIFSELGGTISGDLNLKSKGDKFTLIGENAIAEDLTLMVDFTKVNYTLNGAINFTDKAIEFKEVELKDRFGSKGVVTGALYHKNFDQMRFNSSIEFSNLELLNCTEEDHTDFYGDAFGSGRLEIVGPINKLLLDLSVTTNKNSAIHIPLTAATEVSENSLLTFRVPQAERIDRSREGRENLHRSESELEVKLRANMTPDAAMLIEIDKSVGDIITGYGSGLVTLEINPTKDIFSIQGDYQIQSGSYKFVLQGFIERDFTIEEGGYISFNGDLNKTNLNATAHYRTKASINTLISDTSSVSSRRNVDCQINLSGQLMNPNIGFAIDIPEIDPITKARVSAALNTEDKVVRQVMSLLVSGSFIPDVQSSIVNNSTLLYSNATDLLSNQINKIFNQLDIPLDLSFNYQPGQNGRDLFDAAISAQLFNNRVIVNGNIGSGRYSGRQGEVVGDLDVEIKIDERGRFRGKLFSHSADQYSTYLDFSQRNGVGLVYQEEFNTFRELLQRVFKRRKREKTEQATED